MNARKSKAKQDEFTRARRLREGRCPTHGLGLNPINGDEEGAFYGCPRKDCGFKIYVTPSDKLWKVL